MGQSNKAGGLKVRNVLFFVVGALLLLLFAYYVFAPAPTQGTPLLNSTYGTNSTNENLTVYNVTTADTDGDPVQNVVGWYRNNTPYTVLNMPFEGGTNSTFFRDYSGNQYNGSGQNIVYQNASGHDGFGIINFTTNTTVTYFNLTNPGTKPSFANEPFSIEAWFQTPGCNNAGNIITKCQNTANQNCNYRILIRCANGSIEFYTGNTTAADLRLATTDTGIFYNNTGWHHIVAIFDKAAQRQYLYVDNILTDNVSNPQTNLRTTDTISVGQIAPYNVMSQQFNGSLSLLRIWNDSLSREQIQLLWDNQTTILHTSMTQVGDVWNASITPTDVNSNGTTSFTTSLTILANGVPFLEPLTLNVTTLVKTTNVKVNTTYKDAEGTAGNVNFTWYRNNSVVFTENFTNIPHETVVNSTLNSTFYNRTDLINVTVFAFDGTGSSPTINSTTLTVANTIPTHGTPLLNSTFGGNNTDENLTAYNVSTVDPDFDALTNVVSWYRNQTPYSVVNMPMEGGTNATFLRDYSGNQFNGTGQNMRFENSSGFDGKGAINFTGTVIAYFNLSGTAGVSFGAGSFSIETWVLLYNATSGNGNHHIATKMNNVTNSGIQFRLAVQKAGGYVSFQTANATDSITNIAQQNYEDGKWHHIVAVRDVATNTQYVYVDNILRANLTNTLGSLNVEPNDPIAVGNFRAFSAINGNMNGSIALLRIWNGTLSSQQVQLLWDNRSNVLHSTTLQSGGDTWNASITPNDGTGDGTTKTSLQLVTNTVPGVDVPVFNVSTVTKTSGIKANTTYKDAESSAGTIYFRWLRNNTEVFTDNYTAIAAGTIVNSTLNVTFYNRSDLLNVTVYANDGRINSTTQASTTLTVANTAPTQGTPILNSTRGGNNTDENLTAFNVSVSDPDNDRITTYFEWFNNSRSILNTTTNILSTGNLTGDDRWFVRVIASDLIGNSSPINTSNVTINALSITLLTPDNNSQLTSVNQSFNFNTTISGTQICSLFNNATGTFQNRTSISSVTRLGNNTINQTNIEENATIVWNIECITPAGSRIFAPANFSLLIDRTAPSVSAITPTKATSEQSTIFSATVSDFVGVTSCALYTNNVSDGAMTISGTTASRSKTLSFPGETIVEMYANCTDALSNQNFTRTTVVIEPLRSGGGDPAAGRAPAASAPSSAAEEAGLVGGTKYESLAVGAEIPISPAGIKSSIRVDAIYPNSVRLNIGGVYNFILLEGLTRSFDITGDQEQDLVIYVDEVVSYSKVTLTVLELEQKQIAPTTVPSNFFEDLGEIWKRVIDQEEQPVLEEEPVTQEESLLEQQLAEMRNLLADLEKQISEREATIAALEAALLEKNIKDIEEEIETKQLLQQEVLDLKAELDMLKEQLLEKETGEQQKQEEQPLAQQDQIKNLLNSVTGAFSATVGTMKERGVLTGAVVFDRAVTFIETKVIGSAEMKMLALGIVVFLVTVPLLTSSYFFQSMKRRKQDEIDAYLEEEMKYKGLL